MPAQFVVYAGYELGDLLLCDGGGQVDIPGGQAGEGFCITGKQAMEKRGAASQITQDEEWFFNNLCFVSGEEDIVEQEREPVNKLPDRPDQIEQGQKDDPFSREAGFGVFCREEGAVCSSPK